MRPGMVITLVFAWMLIGALTAPIPANPLPDGPYTVQPKASGQPAAPGDTSQPNWRVEGPYETTRDDALHAALLQAQADVIEYARRRGLAMESKPPLEFIHSPEVVKAKVEQTKDFPSAGLMRRFVLDVQVTPRAWTALCQQEREFRAGQRMAWLARVLAGVVALLAVAAGYFRLDEMTKGYYTTWLRLAAVGFLGTAILGLLLIA